MELTEVVPISILELNVFQSADDNRPRTSEPFWVGMLRV